MSKIKNLLIDAYSSLRKCDQFYQKVDVLFSIIQIKSRHEEYKDLDTPLYLDCKMFIGYYIKSVETRDFGYDFIELEKILKIINSNKDFKEKIGLVNYGKRYLKRNGFDNESDELKKYIHQFSVEHILNGKFELKTLFKLISHLTSYSLRALAVSIIILFLLTVIIFLPAPHESMELFLVKYDNYSSTFFTNHFLNFLAKSVDISTDFKIKPMNSGGVLVLFFLKLIYLGLILNYILKKVQELFLYER